MDEKTLTQQAQEMYDKQVNEVKVQRIVRIMQQKEQNNRRIAEYTKQNTQADELIAKIEAGTDEEGSDY